jgi:hypothetical protein
MMKVKEYMSQEVWAQFGTQAIEVNSVQALNSNKIWVQNDPVQLILNFTQTFLMF